MGAGSSVEMSLVASDVPLLDVLLGGGRRLGVQGVGRQRRRRLERHGHRRRVGRSTGHHHSTAGHRQRRVGRTAGHQHWLVVARVEHDRWRRWRRVARLVRVALAIHGLPGRLGSRPGCAGSGRALPAVRADGEDEDQQEDDA